MLARGVLVKLIFINIPTAFILASSSQVLAHSRTPITEEYGATGTSSDIKIWYSKLTLGHPPPITDEYGTLGT
ncbi:MAG: hypothetical protein WCO29_12145 [Nostocales cyanobacterium ELA583]|jgi:hypothetical protein